MPILTRNLLFLFTVLFCWNLSAQEVSDVIPKEWIFKVSQFRDRLLRNNEQALYQLRDLLDRWDAEGVSPRDQSYITIGIAWASGRYKIKDKYIEKQMPEFLEEKGFDVSVSIEDVRLIEEHFELLDLINQGVLNGEYPFAINKETDFFRELQFYDISSTDMVAEIGAGSGMFSLLLKLIHEEPIVWVNEIDYSNYKLMGHLFEKHGDFINTITLKRIIGNKRSTYLEYIPLNKVIIRNSFHHFKKKDKMLSSIKESLKLGGEVFLYESLRTAHQDKMDCQLEMTREEIINAMTDNGFTFVEDIDFEDQAVFKFMVKPE